MILALFGSFIHHLLFLLCSVNHVLLGHNFVALGKEIPFIQLA